MCNNRHCVGIRADVRSQLQRMILAMQIKNAVDGQRLGLIRLKSAIEMYGTKSYRPILGTLENVLVHFLITSTISAFAARGIDYKKPCHLASSQIKMNRAAFQFESAMNSMQNCPESPIDRCTRRIESDIYAA